MIAEAAIAGVTVCFVACLRFTRYVIDKEQERDPRNEQRRVLERQRNGWVATIKSDTKSENQKIQASKMLLEIDERLIELSK